MPIITLTTDFGESSPYVAQMKGVILTAAPGTTIVDISHTVAPQSIRQGALVLRDVFHCFPVGTVHVAVVDPGVGTDRRILAARIDARWLVAPDNGLISALVSKSPPAEVVELTERQHWNATVSSTFHGRDIMAPVAVRLAQTQALTELGPPLRNFVRIDLADVEHIERGLRGEIVLIDHFGNAISNIPHTAIPPDCLGQIEFECRGEVLRGLKQTYQQAPSQVATVLVGSSGFVEVAVVNGSAAGQLGIQVGDELDCRW